MTPATADLLHSAQSMNKSTASLVGTDVWIFDRNRRVYRKNDRGYSYGAPLYREKWVRLKIVGETSRSWVVDSHLMLKIPKKGPSSRRSEGVMLWSRPSASEPWCACTASPASSARYERYWVQRYLDAARGALPMAQHLAEIRAAHARRGQV